MISLSPESPIDYIRSHSAPFDPQPTQVEPRIEPIEGLRGIVFDVYGTLILSGVGDISLVAQEDRDEVIRELLGAAGFEELAAANLSDLFHDCVKAHQERQREEGILYPEVDIRGVWRSLIAGACPHSSPLSGSLVERIALAYECAVNPVWPAPGLEASLGDLRERGMAMSIISNAQFFTPLLFEAFFGKDLSALGFAAGCNVWSWELLEAKPSKRLYDLAAERYHATSGIKPEELLFVGNDRRNDIWPAASAGFKTALFAGDKRSLRLREDDPDCEGIKPDVILSDLGQLAAVCGG